MQLVNKIIKLIVLMGAMTACSFSQTGTVSLYSIKSEPVVFKNDSITLKGTLYLPEMAGKHPAIVAYHSANGGARSYPFYEHLTKDLPAKGFAVLLFDRRGSGESEGNFDAADFRDLAADGIAGIRYLKTRPEIDTARIGAWGVSQGGWIAPLAATMSSDISFLVIVSGCGVSPAEQMSYGAAFALREANYSDQIIDRATRLRASVDSYYRGQEPAEKVRKIVEEARPEPWFNLAYLPGGGNLPPNPQNTKWFQEMDFDPLPTLSKVKVPVLVFFGQTDRWVPIEKSIEKIREATKNNKNVSINRIPGADHLMMIGTSDSGGHVSQEYVEIMLKWLQKQTAK